MNLGFMFFFNSILLGTGLAMDAFSVSLANGLNEPCMKKSKILCIAGVFAFFQAFMPMLGWVCIHTIVEHFKAFEKLIPFLALILLGYIGIKMIIDGIKEKKEDDEKKCSVGIASLFVQGIATSIDALSVGFTIADYNFLSALFESLIIALVTFIICILGVIIGKKAGTVLEGKASIFGGAILIFIGIEIFVKGLF
ncbi:MAG: manganese efflux pump [Ruminococcaceae bacterium]|nr:manganese efflux pump [Oscillospiraceae bacterium]